MKRNFINILLLIFWVLILGCNVFPQYIKPFEDPQKFKFESTEYKQMLKDEEICKSEAEKLGTKSIVTKLLYVDQCMMYKGYISFSGGITMRSEVNLYKKYHSKIRGGDK